MFILLTIMKLLLFISYLRLLKIFILYNNFILINFILIKLEELHSRLKQRKATLKEREEKLKIFEAQIVEREGMIQKYQIFSYLEFSCARIFRAMVGLVSC